MTFGVSGGAEELSSDYSGFGAKAHIVGPDERMRSDSYLDLQGRSVAASFAGTLAHNGIDTSPRAAR